MPGTESRHLRALVIAGLVGLVPVGCKSNGGSAAPNQSGVATSAVDQEARDGIKKINDYLGKAPDNTEPEKTLLATLNKNNEYLRNTLRDMKCDIWKLQAGHTGNCPGGGSTPPANVPQYPQ